MKFKIWEEYGALNSRPVFSAFKESVKSAGHVLLDSVRTVDDADIHVIWSVLFHGRMSRNKDIWESCIRKNKPIIVLEVGGIQRGETWKVGLNGINRDAYFAPKNNTNERSQQLGLKLRSWRDKGDHILICGQHDKSLQWKSMPRMSEWVMTTIETIQKHTDLPIVFRPHPRCRLDAIEHQYQNVYRDDPIKLDNTYDDFNLSFKDCHAVISWSSNPGPQAIIAGVPVFCGPSSLAYDVGNTDLSNINSPNKPNRQQWLNDYAWTEYTIEEISNGIPLNFLTSRL
jgi:hypothetical protein